LSVVCFFCLVVLRHGLFFCYWYIRRLSLFLVFF
jgi:hypothetical protein